MFKKGDRVRLIDNRTMLAPRGTTGTVVSYDDHLGSLVDIVWDDQTIGQSNGGYTPTRFELVPTPTLDDKIVASKGGATSSKCPDLTQIPFDLLLAAAKRFELGATKHGRDNWRKGLGDKAYILERLNHLIKHAYALSEQLQGRGDQAWIVDDVEGNLGAIAWAAAFLTVAVPTIQGD